MVPSKLVPGTRQSSATGHRPVVVKNENSAALGHDGSLRGNWAMLRYLRPREARPTSQRIGRPWRDLEDLLGVGHTLAVSTTAPTSSANPGVTVHLRARFAETDAMGVVHHSSYLAWLEVARVELLRASGHPYGEIRASGIDFAVVDLHMHYERAVRFDDEVTIEVRLRSATRAAFELEYTLRIDGVRCATGTTRHAAVGMDGLPRRLPQWIPGLLETGLPRRE